MNRARTTRTRQLELGLNLATREAVSRAHIALEGVLVSYSVKRSARRRVLSILIDEAGVRVCAPWAANTHSIERLLREHGAWILQKLAQWHARRPPPCRWRDGDALMFLGNALALRVLPRPATARMEQGALVIGAAAGDTMQVARAAIDWLHHQALACYRERVAHYCRLLEVAVPSVRLSTARTRWGSCHASGRIRLNWRLIQMPLRLVDYVVAHEVTHLIEMNHSPRFWRALAGVLPECTARRAEIRNEGHRYLLV